MSAKGLFSIEQFNRLVDRAIYHDFHNVIIFWGELGKGKTTAMLNSLYRLYGNWDIVLSFILNPHKCLVCGYEWEHEYNYTYELPCPKCKPTTVRSVNAALEAARKNKCVDPFPVDSKTGMLRSFPADTTFQASEKATGKIVQKYPYCNFSFAEIRGSIEGAVHTRMKIPAMGWDDISVYFHRSNIQYMHPDVKNFFSRYSFVRKYVGNLFITVPTPNFVPEQLGLFCTADVMISERGKGDFDVKKEVRNFWGKRATWTKSYDGRDVTWSKIDEKVFAAYEEIRHAHAVEAFDKPEEIFVTTMPKEKEYTAEESLLT